MTKRLWTYVSLLAGGSALAQTERVPEGEGEAIQQITQMISQTVRDAYSKENQAHRDAHRKAHGCVQAKFEVLDSLPEELTTSVFQPGLEYPAWIRYSNGSGRSQDDNEGDGRGMAIKLMNVPGEKVLDTHEGNTMDFLMINHPVFFVKNAEDYVSFNQAVTSGNVRNFFFPSWSPLSWRLSEFVIATKIQAKKVHNPLAIQYFSMTPSLFGQQAVKFSAKPCAKTQQPVDPSDSPNKLREAMVEHLDNQSACFDFMVQKQTHPESMPIEDPTVEWSESKSPFIPVARLTIAPQTFDTAEQNYFCENLSYTPWHANTDHRPLGGINRVRKVVYEEISRLRHDLNGEIRYEPEPDAG